MENHEKKLELSKYLTFFLPVSIVMLLISLTFMGCYYSALSSHIKAMIEFHIFLNNYRQTPRSRNLKKYNPIQEPIYEEQSQFERTEFGGSLAKDSDLYSHKIGSGEAVGAVDATLGLISNKTGYSVIKFNEDKGEFEEVPIDVDDNNSYMDYSQLSSHQAKTERMRPVSYTHLTLPTILRV